MRLRVRKINVRFGKVGMRVKKECAECAIFADSALTAGHDFGQRTHFGNRQKLRRRLVILAVICQQNGASEGEGRAILTGKNKGKVVKDVSLTDLPAQLLQIYEAVYSPESGAASDRD